MSVAMAAPTEAAPVQANLLGAMLNETVDVSLAGNEAARQVTGTLRAVDGAMNVALTNATIDGAGGRTPWAFVVGQNVRFLGVR